jgi:hypothetical protein
VVVEESVGANPHADVSPANWFDWQRESRTFRRFAAWRSRSFTLTGIGEPRRVNAQQVSSEFFPLLGVAPLHGRTISDEDDRPNGPRVAVPSYRVRGARSSRQRFAEKDEIAGSASTGLRSPRARRGRFCGISAGGSSLTAVSRGRRTRYGDHGRPYR